MGIVGHAFLKAFENGFVEFKTVFGIDKRTVVERFVEGYEGGKVAKVVFDEVDHILLLFGKGCEIYGIGQCTCLVILFLRHLALVE